MGYPYKTLSRSYAMMFHFRKYHHARKALHAYKRSITLSKDDVKLALSYYKLIPQDSYDHASKRESFPLLRAISLRKRSAGPMTRSTRWHWLESLSNECYKKKWKKALKIPCNPYLLRPVDSFWKFFTKRYEIHWN